jgi:aldose 1-epimerase
VAEQVLRWEDDGIVLEALPGVGGRLHRISAFGVDLLRTPPVAEAQRDDPFFWGAYHMVPWCNRAPTGPVVVSGRRVELPANFPDGSAIHGQVYAAPWEVVDGTTLRIEAGGDGWPWRYDVHARFRVAPATCGLTVELRNLDDGPMPGGIGLHAWFAKPVQVAVPAERVFPDNVAPAVEPQPVEPPFDLREPGPMADGLDATWTDLTSSSVDLIWPSPGLRARFGFGEAAAFIVAASPADKPAVAVEPQTHAPPALRRFVEGEPGAPTLLAPGEVLALDYELRVEGPDGRRSPGG